MKGWGIEVSEHEYTLHNSLSSININQLILSKNDYDYEWKYLKAGANIYNSWKEIISPQDSRALPLTIYLLGEHDQKRVVYSLECYGWMWASFYLSFETTKEGLHGVMDTMIKNIIDIQKQYLYRDKSMHWMNVVTKIE